jgi:hypothetical protein
VDRTLGANGVLLFGVRSLGSIRDVVLASERASGEGESGLTRLKTRLGGRSRS